MWEVIQATNHLEHFLHYLSEFSFCYHTSKQLERNLKTGTLSVIALNSYKNQNKHGIP